MRRRKYADDWPTDSEAAWVRADRERASRWFAWFAIAFLVAALLPHVWRMV